MYNIDVFKQNTIFLSLIFLKIVINYIFSLFNHQGINQSVENIDHYNKTPLNSLVSIFSLILYKCPFQLCWTLTHNGYYGAKDYTGVHI